MKREKQQIIFWQETHLSDTEHRKLGNMGFRVYFSSYNNGRRRGVPTLISNKGNFQLLSEIMDKEGRYIIVKGTIDQNEVTLVNVYRPPGEDKLFLKKVFNIIAVEASGTLICGGDWNLQLQPKLDSSYSIKQISQEAKQMRNIMQELGLIDVRRDLNPSEKQFTFFSSAHRSHSRNVWFRKT